MWCVTIIMNFSRNNGNVWHKNDKITMEIIITLMITSTRNIYSCTLFFSFILSFFYFLFLSLFDLFLLFFYYFFQGGKQRKKESERDRNKVGWRDSAPLLSHSLLPPAHYCCLPQLFMLNVYRKLRLEHSMKQRKEVKYTRKFAFCYANSSSRSSFFCHFHS